MTELLRPFPYPLVYSNVYHCRRHMLQTLLRYNVSQEAGLSMASAKIGVVASFSKSGYAGFGAPCRGVRLLTL